jgi:hypothetical protein
MSVSDPPIPKVVVLKSDPSVSIILIVELNGVT